MNKKLEQAIDNVEITYNDIIEIANDIMNPVLTPINNIVDDINSQINNLTVDQIRYYILSLQLQAYSLSDIKEKSALKADLAQAIQKQQFAINFNAVEASAAVKEKQATVATSTEILTETLYNLIASMFKTKQDQIHRLVDSLKSVLVSRMQETKFMNLSTAADGTNPYVNTFKHSGSQILNE